MATQSGADSHFAGRVRRYSEDSPSGRFSFPHFLERLRRLERDGASFKEAEGPLRLSYGARYLPTLRVDDIRVAYEGSHEGDVRSEVVAAFQSRPSGSVVVGFENGLIEWAIFDGRRFDLSHPDLGSYPVRADLGEFLGIVKRCFYRLAEG